MKRNTNAMRVSLTLLLALSFLITPLFQALANEIPVEPAPEEILIEPFPTLGLDLEIETPDPVEPEPVIEVPTVVIEVPVVQTPVLQTEEEEYDSFTLEDTFLTVAGGIDLPNGCVITDGSGGTHVFPLATTTEYLAACALTQAVEEGIITDFDVSNASFGIYVTSINGVDAGADEYWSLWHNGGYADCGIACLSLSTDDSLMLVRTTFDGVEKDRITLTVDSKIDAYNNVIVPDSCAIVDSSGATHTFPQGSDLLGVCALVAAVDEDYISEYQLTNASFGLYVTQINGITPAADEYWALWVNGGYADCGIACLPVSSGDTISLIRTSFTDVQSDRADLRVIGSVHVEEEAEDDGGDTGTGGTAPDTFDTVAAFSYLQSIQNEDGEVANELVTDWAAIAFSVSGAPSQAKTLLKNYLKTEDIDVDTASDYERHAMAMLALNLNPYTAGPTDYITPIVESFDGTQVGEDAYINDDIFALFPLTHVGYDEDDQLIQNIVSFLLAQQEANGSWENGTDLTAAAIQALTPLSSLPGVPNALERAEEFLRGKQQSNGGFGDPFATAWTIQAIEALGQSPSSWRVGDNTPLTYLASVQNDDGSVTTSSGTESDKAWATAYAITAAKGATWNELMDDFRRQEPSADDDTGNDSDTKATPATKGEVLGATDEVVPETLAPAFTYEAPAQEASISTTTTAPQQQEEIVTEEVPIEVEVATTQTATVEDAEGGSWLMETIGSLFQGLMEFLKGLFF